MMPTSDEFATPTRGSRDLFPSSPESRFSSPPIFGLNSWTPGRNLWPLGLNVSEGVESSPNHRFVSFSTPGSLDLTPNQSDFGDNSGIKGSDNCKRGRPRADVINHLIQEGSSSPSGIKCKVCNRVFPREKSLQAHLRTHTGERPYVCDYPGCTRAFTQSGQLKTHQRLHAGEKPFVCSSPGCGNRYTHANRTCPLHPYHKPQRSAELVLQPTLSAGEDPVEVSKWLENYRKDRLDKTPAKIGSTGAVSTPALAESPKSSPQVMSSPLTMFSSPVSNLDLNTQIDLSLPSKKSKTKRGLASELEQENVEISLAHTPIKIPHLFYASPFSRVPVARSPVANNSLSAIPRSPMKSSQNILPNDLSIKRAALGDITPVTNEQSSNVSLSPQKSLGKRTPPASPVKTLNLKKRWLKEVVQEQKRQTQTRPTTAPAITKEIIEQDVENLASPIRWSENEPDSSYVRFRRSPLAWSAVSALVEMAEQTHSSNQPLNLSTSKEKC